MAGRPKLNRSLLVHYVRNGGRRALCGIALGSRHIQTTRIDDCTCERCREWYREFGYGSLDSKRDVA